MKNLNEMSHTLFRKLISLLLALAVSLAEFGSAQAAAGDLDPTFDTDGKVTTDFGGSDGGSAIVLQSDGKILVAGSSVVASNTDFALARYNNDGSLDTTFDGDGRVTTDFVGDDVGQGVVIQPDGKIVVAGYSGIGASIDFALARYNSDGSLDPTFDGDGLVVTDFGTGNADLAHGIALQSDGKIVVAGGSEAMGQTCFSLARYNPDGSLDLSLDSDGLVFTDLNGVSRGVVIQPDSKILLAGFSFQSNPNSDFALTRLNSDGSFDPTFDGDGKLTTDFGGWDDGNALILQPDGKIIVAGSSGDYLNPQFALARYNHDGLLDPTFDGDGLVVTDFGSNTIAYAAVLQPDGKIVVAGDIDVALGNHDFALARYNQDGSLDTTFGSDGLVTTDFDGNTFEIASSVALQTDNKIILGGFSSEDFALARYDAGISVLSVTIDVKPRRSANRIAIENNTCQDDDNLYVAILTTPEFDALTVDISSLELGDPLLTGTARPIRSRTRDVGADGDLDLSLTFSLCELVSNSALALSTTELVLKGTTLDSVAITGMDAVRVVHEDD